MVTFAVSEVEPTAARFAPCDVDEAFGVMMPDAHVEQWDAGGDLALCNSRNALVVAAWEAFIRHHPLRLSPDAVWFTLGQGFARAVNLDPEAFRARFVRHEGQLVLTVVRPDFVLGRPNPWPEVFTTFSGTIASHVGKVHTLLRGDFSTTGPMEKVAYDVLAMDAFQAYFKYEVGYGCGIPTITLTGTADDWRSVRARAAVLAEYGLSWWLDELLPVLDQFVRAAEGTPDVPFWQSMVRYRSGSVGKRLTGWVHTLCPFLYANRRQKTLVRNPHMHGWWEKFHEIVSPAYPDERTLSREERIQRFFGGPSLDEVPGSLATAPMSLVPPIGEALPARVAAGLLGGRQHDDGALEPAFGWAVVLLDPNARTEVDEWSERSFTWEELFGDLR